MFDLNKTAEQFLYTQLQNWLKKQYMQIISGFVTYQYSILIIIVSKEATIFYKEGWASVCGGGGQNFFG